MQHIDVSKKRPARWPWLLGLALLVLVLWGVTVLLRTEPAPEPAAAVPTAADTLPPAMIPSDSRGAAPVRDGPASDARVPDDTAGDGPTGDGPTGDGG